MIKVHVGVQSKERNIFIFTESEKKVFCTVLMLDFAITEPQMHFMKSLTFLSTICSPMFWFSSAVAFILQLPVVVFLCDYERRLS